MPTSPTIPAWLVPCAVWEQSLPAYCVFTDATLTAIAETKPADRGALSRIPGVGSAKLERYADEVLAILGVPAGAATAAGEESQLALELDEPSGEGEA